MKLRPFLLASLGLVVFVMVACMPSIELLNPAYLQDTSLIDDAGSDCSAPCWHGITPGVTAWDTGVAIIQDDAAFAEVNEQPNEETGEIEVRFQRAEGITCCLFYSGTGETVDQILLQFAPDQMTVEQVIEAYGEPTYVSGSDHETSSILSPEQAQLALIYPELNAIFYAFVAGKESGELSAESPIVTVILVRKVDIDLIVKYNAFYTWDGYKSYAEYIDGTYDITAAPTLEEGVTEEAAATEDAAATEEAVVTEEATSGN